MLIEKAFCVAVIAFVYAEILIQGGEVLNGWYKFLERKIGHIPWLFKPLVDCSKCVAGQIAFWSYPFFYFYHYSLFYHIAYISISILITLTIKALYKKFIEQWLMS